MFKLILACVLFYVVDAISSRSLIINTTSGPVKGKLNEFNGIEYYSYQGIPYAESPTGNMRFKPPLPKKPWTDIWDATEEGPVCSQLPKFYRVEETAEDCLNLNVYVPKNGSDKLLPVLVFMHGGALQYLSGRIDIVYAPQILLGREIIHVSMNYRLGPFGFLSLGIEEASGNAGIKDVLLSLNWVKENIKRFGGNPDKVTIGGHSSGSVIVNLLLLTNKSEGLFNQAMLMSGSALAPRSFTRHPMDISFQLAKELGIEIDNVYKVLEDLQKVDALKILDAFSNMSKTYDSPLRIYAPFAPTKEVESDHALFVMDPTEALLKNNLKLRNVPLLVGITSREAISMIPHILQNVVGVIKILKNPEHLIPSNIEYPIGSQRSTKLADLASEFYFGKKFQHFTLATLIDFMSDVQNIYGVYFWMEKYKKMVNNNDLYLYMFDFNGDLNRNQFFFTTSITGTGHGDDVPYVFVSNKTKSMFNHIDEKSNRMLDAMINVVSNFIYYGNPTPENLNKQFLWANYGIERNYLLLNENPVIQTFNSSTIYPRIQFWEKVYNDYYEYVHNGGQLEKKIIP